MLTKCWYIRKHITEYYLTNKKKEVQATTQMKLEHIMLSPKSQSKKTTYGRIPPIGSDYIGKSVQTKYFTHYLGLRSLGRNGQ